MEHPILFSSEMVRAILDGRKTQTRRVVKPQPTYPARYDGVGLSDEDSGIHYLEKINLIGFGTEKYIPMCCPYGKPGDTLWVRESFAPVGNGLYFYKAQWEGAHPTWKPSIHMPRSASRVTLEVVSVRVERVREINEEDAIAEGAQCAGFPASLTNRDAFAKLWDSVNSKRGYGWASNPWVWVVEFKRV